eukprot:COSAG02_NODE_9045_length_2351_cov_7.818367_1_plen_643_part_10
MSAHRSTDLVAHGIPVNADGMVGPTVRVVVRPVKPPEPPPPARRRSATAAPVEATQAAAALGEHHPERVGNEPLVHICLAFVVVAAAASLAERKDLLKRLDEWCRPGTAIAVSKTDADKVVECVQQLTDSREENFDSKKGKAPPIKPPDQYLWSCQRPVQKVGGWQKQRSKWASFEKKLRTCFDKVPSKVDGRRHTWSVKANPDLQQLLRRELQNSHVTAVIYKRVPELIKSLSITARSVSLRPPPPSSVAAPDLKPNGGDHPAAQPGSPAPDLTVGNAQPTTLQRQESCPSSPATEVGSPDTRMERDEWKDGIEERVTKLESRLLELPQHLSQRQLKRLLDESGESGRDDGSKRARADLAYWMPLATGLRRGDLTPGTVVAITEAESTQTLEVQKLERADKSGNRWFPAVVSNDWYHVANKPQTNDRDGVEVCMLGFVPIKIDAGHEVKVHDSVYVFLGDGAPSIRPRTEADEDNGVFVGRALEGSDAVDAIGPRCLVSLPLGEGRARCLSFFGEPSKHEALAACEAFVAGKLKELQLQVDDHEQRLEKLETQAIKKISAAAVEEILNTDDIHSSERQRRAQGFIGRTQQMDDMGERQRRAQGFIGRTQQMDDMSTACAPGKRVAIVISGGGGFGKTTLAKR